MNTLNELGWQWRENGAIITIADDSGRSLQWFVPLAYIRMTFGQELAAVGCPLQPSVGDPPTVAGLFGAIGRGISRAAKSVSRAVKKTTRKVGRAAKKVSRGVKKGLKAVVPKAIQRAARKVQRAAMKAYRATSGVLKKGLDYVGYVPVLGNVAKLAKTAVQMGDRGMAGKLPTVKQLGRAAMQAGTVAADYIAPGAGTLAGAALTAGKGLASGQRWDRALKAGGIKAASSYVPEAVARGALRAGEAVAAGKRLDRALKAGGIAAASQYVPEHLLRGALRAGEGIASGRRIDRALSSGALTAARGYVPKGLGRSAFDAARDIASGKRVDRSALKHFGRHVPGGKKGRMALSAARDLASGKRLDRILKKQARKLSKSPFVRRAMPSSEAFQAASRAVQVAREAKSAAKRLKRGRPRPTDAQKLFAARVTNRGIAELAKRARQGDAASSSFFKTVRQLR